MPYMENDDSGAFTSLISLGVILELDKETQWKMRRFLTVLKNALELKVGKHTAMTTVVSVPAGTLAMDGVSLDEIPGFVDKLNVAISARMPKPKDEKRINLKHLYSLDLSEASFPLFEIEGTDERGVKIAASYPPAVEKILERFDRAGVAAKKLSRPPSFYITKDAQGRYLHNERPLPVEEGTDYWRVFDILHGLNPEGGFASYKRLRSEVRRRITATRVFDDAKLNKYMLDKLDDHNGFLHHAKIPMTVPSGKKRFQVIRGKGIQFNNRKGA